jgi:hypothetical protein
VSQSYQTHGIPVETLRENLEKAKEAILSLPFIKGMDIQENHATIEFARTIIRDEKTKDLLQVDPCLLKIHYRVTSAYASPCWGYHPGVTWLSVIPKDPKQISCYDGRMPEGTGRMPHPHVYRDGKTCWDGYRQMIDPNFQKQDWVSVVYFTWAFLNDVKQKGEQAHTYYIRPFRYNRNPLTPAEVAEIWVEQGNSLTDCPYLSDDQRIVTPVTAKRPRDAQGRFIKAQQVLAAAA